jgi:hypothetical protein
MLYLDKVRDRRIDIAVALRFHHRNLDCRWNSWHYGLEQGDSLRRQLQLSGDLLGINQDLLNLHRHLVGLFPANAFPDLLAASFPERL